MDPRERGFEFLKICGSSSSEVCDVSCSCCNLSLSLPLLKAQVPHEESRPQADGAWKPEGARKHEETHIPQKGHIPEEPLSPEEEAITSPLRTVYHLLRTLLARSLAVFIIHRLLKKGLKQTSHAHIHHD